MNSIPPILIFDVNETLLEMTPLKENVNRLLENENGFDMWFPTLLQYSLVETTIRRYHDFSKIAQATLKMEASRQEKNISEQQIKECLSVIRKLKAHSDVSDALRSLADKGHKLIALSNGAPGVLKEQLDHAELTIYFKHILSVEKAGHYKPHPAPYLMALKVAGEPAASAMMIAAHPWDITGAQAAGIKTCLINRKGVIAYPLSANPDIIIKSLTEL